MRNVRASATTSAIEVATVQMLADARTQTRTELDQEKHVELYGHRSVTPAKTETWL